MKNVNLQEDSVIPVEHWHALDNGLIQCDLCPRECKLHEGQRGFCFVRGRKDNQMWLTSYGRSSGFCIDPIEKKPLNHFLPGSSVLSFGTAGCNLACKFCQNWDMSKARDMDRLLDQAAPEALAQAAKQNGCASVAYTYNDPVIFYEYALDTAQACREQGVKNVAVTAGYISEQPREAFFKSMDAANIDLKAFNERFYEKLTGAKLQPVLETIEYAVNETDCWVELTTLLIPGENDSETEIGKMSEWILAHCGESVPLHFTAYHPDYRMMNNPPTPASTLEKAREIAMSAGLKYVFTGNVVDPEGQATYCPCCQRKLIGRRHYEISEWHLHQGHCEHCGCKIDGIFADRPGTWGNRRLPVRLNSF
ncbi:AmmeMemoRadiSam system radical SAM enzyme [Thiomicrorhabdus sp. zzn3]|uniref:AmmeMemoRadiSam system radical SAM enzyme n=1 Tax=Thiomicrorhabdus sp. zzn3 TaxID=3039775 RepID=UPI0024374509|nr:AmmeMemoRadiSam system radical SAM enzyme [Thiomicrorhabdus sp. zzn3]MDG6777956.1 AmmeMemoRadiSam system radical SAM enzyme [Thiomicrorhabdus sp. zzn3]